MDGRHTRREQSGALAANNTSAIQAYTHRCLRGEQGGLTSHLNLGVWTFEKAAPPSTGLNHLPEEVWRIESPATWGTSNFLAQINQCHLSVWLTHSIVFTHRCVFSRQRVDATFFNPQRKRKRQRYRCLGVWAWPQKAPAERRCKEDKVRIEETDRLHAKTLF